MKLASCALLMISWALSDKMIVLKSGLAAMSHRPPDLTPTIGAV
jgi:hypothetical protein